jgi:hypothetical protein
MSVLNSQSKMEGNQQVNPLQRAEQRLPPALLVSGRHEKGGSWPPEERVCYARWDIGH